MKISAQIIVSYHNVLRRLGGKSGVYSPRRRRKNQSPRLRFIRLVIEASIAGYLDVCCAIADINCGPVLWVIPIVYIWPQFEIVLPVMVTSITL